MMLAMFNEYMDLLKEDYKMIKPTVGRVVLYHPSVNTAYPHFAGVPLAAIITHVHSDSCINLAVFDADGNSHGETSVDLVQDDNSGRPYPYAEWMPYQKGQAAKTEKLENEIKKGGS